MKNILIALAIGIIAGIIDIFPMLKQKVPKFSIYYIFAQWVFIGLIIPFVSWEMQPWLKGLIIGVLGMAPAAIIAYHRNRKRVLSILLYAMPLGAAIGIVANKFIG